MALTVFLLLAILFVMVTAGSATTIILLKNIGRDTLKIGQIAESKVHEELQSKQIKHYSLHS